MQFLMRHSISGGKKSQLILQETNCTSSTQKSPSQLITDADKRLALHITQVLVTPRSRAIFVPAAGQQPVDRQWAVQQPPDQPGRVAVWGLGESR